MLELLVRLPNWVGDAVMAWPALHALQQSGLRLMLSGRPWIRDLFQATDLPLLPLGASFLENRRALANVTDVNRALLFTNSFSSAFLMRSAGKKVIGYHTWERLGLLTAGPSTKKQQHEVLTFWDIAQFACAYWFPEKPFPKVPPDKIKLPLSPAAHDKAAQFLAQFSICSPFWVVCPFAQGQGKMGESKIWPHWRALSARLTPQHTLVVCPGPHEASHCSDLVPYATVLHGLNLNEYAAVLARAAGVIANDSGPMHLAAAVGAPTLGIFGCTDPARSHVWGGAYVGALGKWPSVEEVLGRIAVLNAW